MSQVGAPSPEFIQHVRSALTHLYDYAYLQNHELASLLASDYDLDNVTRAQRVRRALLHCMEALQPQGRADNQSEAARAYTILMYRYVDGISMEEITQKLTLSRRQVYREHAKGVLAVATLLWDQLARPGPVSDKAVATELTAKSLSVSRLDVAEDEVKRLRQSVSAEALRLSDLWDGILKMLGGRIEETGVELRISSPADLPLIMADRVMLRQALLNLLSYALDTVSRGALVISVSPQNSHILIEMCDELVDGGVQLPTPGETKREGIGLTVAQKLIEAQGGEVQVSELERDKHWRAQIRLPAMQLRSILVVDDNDSIVKLFERYLAGHQVLVVGARDGEQAIALAQELQPELIILDVMLPHQDGWEILQQLKEHPETHSIPVIICSVLYERQLALSMGASDYITKPVSQDELLAVLRRWLGQLHPVA